MDASDESLMTEFRQTRDARSIAELIRRYQGWAFNIALSMLHRRQDAEDATQQAFLDLIRSHRTYRPDAPFRPWFGRIVMNACLKLTRSRHRKERHEEAASRRQEAFMTKPAQEAVRWALQELEPDLKAPLILCYQHGCTQADAAAILDVPPRTLSERIRQGLEELRRRLPPAGLAVGILGIEDVLAQLTTEPVPASLTAKLEDLPGGVKAILSTSALAARAVVPIATGAGAVLLALVAIGMCSVWLWRRNACSPSAADQPVVRAATSPVSKGGVEVEQGGASGGTASTVDLRGRVVRASDHAPLKGATVTLTDRGFLEWDGETTDPEGKFAFRSLKTGSYRLKAQHGLSRPVERVIDVSADGQSDLLVALDDGTASVTLIALDDAGLLVPDARFSLIALLWDGNMELATDGQGKAEATRLPVGRYKARSGNVEVPDFALQEGEHESLNIVVRGSASITGRIFTDSGERGADLVITAKSPERTSDVAPVHCFSANSMSDGSYAFERLPAGRYELRVGESLFFASLQPAGTEVELAFGEARRCDLRVKAGPVGLATLHGIVRDAKTKEPIAGAEIWCECIDETTRTDARGEFTLEYRRAILVDIEVSSEGYQDADLEVQLRPGVNEVMIELDREKSERSIPSAALLPAVIIQGRLVYRDDDGPVKDARISGLGRSIITGADGSFEGEVRPGATTIEVQKIGATHVWTIPADIGIAPRQTLLLKIDRDDAVLSGKIIGMSSEARVSVRLAGVGHSASQMVSASETRYALRVPAGTYTLTVYAAHPLTIDVKREITLGAGEEKMLDVNLPVGSSRLHGRVVTVDGSIPPPGSSELRLSVLTEGSTGTIVRFPDKQGQYEFDGLAAGPYRLEWLLTAGGTLLHEESLILDGAAPLEKNFTVPFSGILDLEITDQAGEKDLFHGSEVTLRSLSWGKVVVRKERSTTRAGCDSLPGLLAPGVYELVVSRAGFHEYRKDLAIPERGIVTEAVRLQEK
ncbi:MAG: sigma-70 family RNA polymerase sigma factor [Planctomycetes bacterium]|nr:sigma-70 family RNA polymerase sigma factor [Planctomycetota bacterium]